MIRNLVPMTGRRRRPNTTPAQRARWVRRLRGSGLSQQAFARQHGLPLSTLGLWLRQAAPTTPVTSPPLALGEVSLPALLSRVGRGGHARRRGDGADVGPARAGGFAGVAPPGGPIMLNVS